MAKAPVIRIPKPKRSSFNPDRPMGDLLQNQVRYFQAHENELPEEYRTGVEHHTIKTEGEAAEYIRKMSDILHPVAAEEKKEAKRTATARKSASAGPLPHGRGSLNRARQRADKSKAKVKVKTKTKAAKRAAPPAKKKGKK